ncbi:HEAT repeat-containing protein 6 isoform X2 [Punica granatum]|uniref:HEAT repeat-containing protein 6 isoform X2 n=1 Tax=Punica granatum TaxID=22663 RepID=A0A6P8DWW2_PUNGR|nr:HEAT repeat-containing protein 6 isoform X2 [Punica granatum]
MAASSSSSALPPVRSWRTAFLTLRDETTTSPPRASVPDLLHNLVFSNSAPLIAAAAELPPQEVASDVLFLIELVADADQVGENAMAAYSLTFHLINDISRRVSLDINASYWKRILDSFGKIIGVSIGKASLNGEGTGNPSRIRPVMNCFETLRILIAAHLRISSLSENIELVKFLGSNIARFHAELSSFSDLSGTQRYPAVAEKRIPRSGSLWEVQTLCFTMLGEAFSRVGSLIPIDTWQSVIEVLSKEMDVLASKNLLVEDNTMAKFYAALLQCLHLVLVDKKSSLSDHVPSFVAALRLFLNYGLASCRPQMTYKTVGEKEKEVSSLTSKTSSSTDGKVDHKPYRPPHLRRNDAANLKKTKDLYAPALSDHGSDSEYSDSDGSVQDNDSIRRSKVRVSALLCLQDLCQADPKAFTTQWTMLLPTNDVLESRKFDATLMTCLLFDPYLKARLASASTLAVMLDGPSSVSLQVAEYKDSSKRGSYTSLSSSLGQILMQLHKGVIHLVMRETHSGLLASLLKILMLLISSTPYARMPEDLLPTVIINLQAKVEGGFPSNNDDTSLLATAISCLAGALSTSSSSLKVQEILAQEIEGFNKNEKRTGVLSTLFRLCEMSTSPTISFEALQALRALSHSYPKIVVACWEHVFAIVHSHMEVASPEVPTSPRRGLSGNSIRVNGEKVIAAAIKVLDDCLRALSGFKGTEDLLDDKLLDTPFTSDCIREKKIFSAPSCGDEASDDYKDDQRTSQSGGDQWEQAINKFLRRTLRHSSHVVRAASVTCFAGITSSAFYSLKKQHQDFVLSSTIYAAVEDVVPSVRSAACRAIGVITCFPEICRSAGILGSFVKAVETNTQNSVVSVRITASWALANICESLHRWFNDVHPECFVETNARVVALIECALRLTNDGDKVQWNVCHALSNLFRNETLSLKDEDWAPSVFSILLLLLRDSSNFKIRIQAAAALAVPESVLDYGRSFTDVVKGVEHVLENLDSYQMSAPSSFKYRSALEKQLTITMLHVLHLASSSDHQPLKDFIVKKASFLEEWLKGLCSSVKDISAPTEIESVNTVNQKKEVISKALRSLTEVFEGMNHHATAQKFEVLYQSIQ